MKIEIILGAIIIMTLFTNTAISTSSNSHQNSIRNINDVNIIVNMPILTNDTQINIIGRADQETNPIKIIGNNIVIEYPVNRTFNDVYDNVAFNITVSKEIAMQAVIDYFSGLISKEEAIGIIIQYFRSVVPDEPLTGQYYGENIEVILYYDPTNITDEEIRERVTTIQNELNELRPYKNLTILQSYIHTNIDSFTVLQTSLIQLATQIEADYDRPENYKFLVLIWTPQLKIGTGETSSIKIGKYIYTYALIKDAIDSSVSILSSSNIMKHEIGHDLGLKGDNNIGGDIPIASETMMDYAYPDSSWLAEDEKKVTTYLLFNNGFPVLLYPFGCRNGTLIFWYHNYQYTSKQHSEYSATWNEVKIMIDKINQGATINRDICS